MKIQYSITIEFRKISVVGAKLYGDQKKKERKNTIKANIKKKNKPKENILGEKQENLFKKKKEKSFRDIQCLPQKFFLGNKIFNIFVVFALILLEKEHTDKYF